MPDLAATRAFARLSPTAARVVVAVTIGITLLLVAITFSSLRSGYADAPDRGPSDFELYRAEADRIHAGEAYYPTVADELRTRGYPTRSVFNWRTPLPVWLLGVLPDVRIGQTVLALLAVGMWMLAFGLLDSQLGRPASVVGLLAISGVVLPCVLGNLFVMPEMWAGILIGLSAVAYGGERRKLGFAAALAALFVRELSGLWCLVCLASDVRERHWRSIPLWSMSFAAYAVFYAVHLRQVLPLISESDVAHDHGWVCLGGPGFVISIAQVNTWLLLVPQWLTALFLAAALVGAAEWSSPAGQRIGLGVAGYVVAFSIVGQPFNQYWGSLTAPLFALSASAFPAAAADLWRAALGRSAGSGRLAPLRRRPI